jgi:hypothetical protein
VTCAPRYLSRALYSNQVHNLPLFCYHCVLTSAKSRARSPHCNVPLRVPPSLHWYACDLVGYCVALPSHSSLTPHMASHRRRHTAVGLLAFHVAQVGNTTAARTKSHLLGPGDPRGAEQVQRVLRSQPLRVREVGWCRSGRQPRWAGEHYLSPPPFPSLSPSLSSLSLPCVPFID